MRIKGSKTVRASLVASAATAALVFGTPQAASAVAATSCTAWGLAGTCRTATIPASSGHRIYYHVATCGWANVYDAQNGRRVGGSNLIGTGWISGLYGSYYMVVRSANLTACLGGISS